MMPDVRVATAADKNNLISLWVSCDLTRPHNDPVKDIELAIAGPSSVILIAENEGDVCGSIMVGHDGHRGWVYYMAVHPEHQRQGLGRQLISEAEAWLADKKIWKCMLMIRDTNTAVRDFYARLGYAEEPRTVMSRAVIDPFDRP